SFLARPVAEGGAGMSLVNSAGWIVATQVGAYFGFLSFGFIADGIGRRRTFVLFMVCAALLVPFYRAMAAHHTVLLLLSPVLGYIGNGYYSIFGSIIAEQY